MTKRDVAFDEKEMTSRLLHLERDETPRANG